MLLEFNGFDLVTDKSDTMESLRRRISARVNWIPKIDKKEVSEPNLTNKKAKCLQWRIRKND